MRCQRTLSAALGAGMLLAGAHTVRAQCPSQPPIQNFTGTQTQALLQFIPGEQAGAVFSPPPADFPVEVLDVGIGWGSMFGGNPDQLETAIHVYAGGLPDPGAPVFTYPGPILKDGIVNVFDFEPFAGEIIVHSGPITLTLEFLNQSSGNPFGSSVVHDNDGCQAGKNAVFTSPGGWAGGCAVGMVGDFVFWLRYRSVSCSASGSVPDGSAGSTPLVLGKTPSGDLTLAWGASCSVSDDDYQIYEGALGSWSSHGCKKSTTGGATSTQLSPGSQDHYYLVVPTDGNQEGSYGKDGNLARSVSQGSPVCLTTTQSVGC